MDPILRKEVDRLLEMARKQKPEGGVFYTKCPEEYATDVVAHINNSGIATAVYEEKKNYFGKLLKVKIFESNFNLEISFDGETFIKI
ncbi:hypothetical protein [Bdellovibrio sp. HCB-162]|uniref:hypothetical protein n=1 Tax=Bdellovibrio sp. HCB-162 TaxID=3394234 RepID=UPI0039BC738E